MTEPLTQCRICDDHLDVYQDFDHRFCECCTENLLTEGTTHFKIFRYPSATHAFIAAKPHTFHDAMFGTHAAVFHRGFPAKAKDENDLLGELLLTEEKYVSNRKLVLEGRAA